jgi:hypothetical protein
MEFALTNEVADYVLPILEMTDRLFPQAVHVETGIEEDPEISGDAHLVFHVSLPALDAELYARSKFRWGEELLQICPATLVCIFRCRLSTVEP